jgi:hypothetical protein
MARKPDLKQIDRIVRELKLSKGQRRILHDDLAGKNYTIDEIREIAKAIKELYPNK